MADAFDIGILGSGSTAFAAAIRAENRGARVLMVEKSALGGTCINWGCVPSKTLIHGALFLHEGRLAETLGFGRESGDIDYERIAAHRNETVLKLRQTKYLDVLAAMPTLSLVKGTGRIVDCHTIAVGEERYRCERILIATGGAPRVPSLPGLEEVDYLTSRSALLLKRFPSSLLILGGGVIALELGQMYRRMGVRVTILEHGARLLASVEEAPVLALQQALVEEGMEIFLNADVREVRRGGAGVVARAVVAGKTEELTAEMILLAVGTAPVTEGIGLEAVGVKVDRRGYVVVDNRMRTNVSGIWAAGDVVGGMMIATVGAREGIVAVDDMLNDNCGCSIDYTEIPMAIFTDPEVGIVGHTEESAKKAGFDVVTNTTPVTAVAKAHITTHVHGAVKIVVERATGRILGVHLSAHRGAELINEAALAVKFRLTVQDLAGTLHVYPSIGEILRVCAQGFTRDVSKLSCCAE